MRHPLWVRATAWFMLVVVTAPYLAPYALV